MKLYIGRNERRNSHISMNFGFDTVTLNLNSKNNIENLLETLFSHNNHILVSDNVDAYYVYHASGIIKCKSLIINPMFFTKKGRLILPQYDMTGSNDRRIVLLSKNISYLDDTIKYLESNNDKYYVVDVVSDDVVDKYIKFFLSDDVSDKKSNLGRLKAVKPKKMA